MAVRVREVTDRFAAQQIIRQHALFDHRDFLRFHAFVVHVVKTGQRLVIELFGLRIVHHCKRLRQHATFIVGRKLSVRARRISQVRTDSQNVGNDQPLKQ